MKQQSNINIIPVDDNENEENDIEIIKQQKKAMAKLTKRKKGSKNSKESSASLPEYIPIKPEELTHVEFVLGDYQTFNTLSTFSKMTSLSLINQNIQSITSVVNHIPIKENIKYFCLSENNISSLTGIDQLPNLEDLQLNFNNISEIHQQVHQLKNLKTIWLCENKISKIENLPDAIENLWLANNQIQYIPEEISNYTQLSNLNLSGNLLIDFQDIYNLQTLKSLKCLYLSDINFGDNPLCQYFNYRNLMIHFFPYIDNLDQIIISPEERKEVANLYTKKFLFFKNKIRNNHKICKMIFRLMKTNKLFMNDLKLQQVCFFSQREKMLNFAKYEKEILMEVNEINLDEIKKEINVSNDKLNICLKLMENNEMNFKCIKNQISENNNLSIVANFYEMETNGNFKIEPGNVNLKWTKSCMDLVKTRISKGFLEKNKIKGISFLKIFKFLNKKSKILFDALYDNLIDVNGMFGEEKKFFDFFFLILPKEKSNIQSMLQIVFEEDSEKEIKLVLCDNISDLDEYEFNLNQKKKFTAMLCKCATFENNIYKTHSLLQLNNYDSIVSELNKVDSKKDIIQLIKDDISYYLYNIKGLVIPEYFVEYEYIVNNDENNFINDETGFISSYNIKLMLDSNYENLFNSCAKDLFSKENEQFYSDEVINKYSNCKFGEYKELDNGFMFLNKNSVLGFILKCFKFQNFNEYKNDISKIKEKLGEIANLKFNKSIMQIIFSKEEREKIKIKDVTIINLFNLGITDEKLNEFLDKIKKESESDETIKYFSTNITEFLIAKNEIKYLNINTLVDTFPNVKKIDFSHNKIGEVISTKDQPSEIDQIESIDISFNSIQNFSYIIHLLKSLNSLTSIIYYANPFKTYFTHLNDSITGNSLTKEKKDALINEYNKIIDKQRTITQMLNISEDSGLNKVRIKHFDNLFDCYCIGEQYNDFSKVKYFREKDNNENNFKSLILSKRKLLSIPTLENQKDIQILYINLNKISKIDNLTQFNNLIELYIQNNKISKIENLPSSLVKLDISNNELTNLDGIEAAEKLKWLNIENNAIQSIVQLISLTKLNELYSAGNFINNIKECYQLRQLPNLEIVDISRNEVCTTVHEIRLGMIFYCKKVQNFNRINVDESERKKAIEYFTGKLTSEILEQRLGQGFNTKALIELDLSSLKLKDEMGMFSKENYPKLQKLNLSKNLFKSFDIFGFLPSLVELNMNYNLVTVIFNKNDKKIANKGIFGLPNLESLEMAGNSITNLYGIQILQNLKILVLRENNIAKIDSINKMNNLTFLDLSFNKLRSVERTNIGYLPNVQILLCDNNFLKNVNAFAKLEALQTLSFENNKLFDYPSLEKLSQCENLKELNLTNNPISKEANYRTKMIKLFERLTKLDGNEITTEEKDMIALEMQMGMDDSINGYYNNGMQYQRITSAGFNYNNNIQKIQDKGLKKVNYVQLDLLNPNLAMGKINGILPALPHINRQYCCYKEKPTSSEVRKIGYQNNSKPKNMNSKINHPSIANQQKRNFPNKDIYGFVLGSLVNELKPSQYFVSPKSKK